MNLLALYFDIGIKVKKKENDFSKNYKTKGPLYIQYNKLIKTSMSLHLATKAQPLIQVFPTLSPLY